MNFKTEKSIREAGITLIALIITIIIMIILAAVSVTIITRSNVINYAKNGANEYQIREEEELDMFAQVEKIFDTDLEEEENSDIFKWIINEERKCRNCRI